MLAAADAAEGEARLSLVGSEVGADLDRIVDFLEASASWVDAGLAQAEAEGEVATDLDGNLQEAVDKWLEILRDFSSVDASGPLGHDADEEGVSMAEGSLLLDAKRLTAKARVKRDNAAGMQADGQFSTALSKLRPSSQN